MTKSKEPINIELVGLLEYKENSEKEKEEENKNDDESVANKKNS